jgi:putative protease
MQKIEIMAPAGSKESMAAAINAGAGSVYFGIEGLNMRARSANNFKLKDLERVVQLCSDAGAKSYLTVNTILYDEDIHFMKVIIGAAKYEGIDAIIASDIAAINYCNKAGIPCHISTQQNISNFEAVKYFAQYADVMVLARELNLEQVKSITERIDEHNITGPSGEKVRIEIFAHGALCMAVSGKCYLSLHEWDKSANRGACLQACRRGYIVTDKDSGEELEIDNEYIMSPKDLKTIHFLDKIIDAGVRVLKIEGRGRPPEYVKRTVECYRDAADAVLDGTYTPEKIEQWNEKLATVFNRGFWNGYYLGQRLGEWTSKYGSHATKKKTYIGDITNYYKKAGVAEISLKAGGLNPGEEVMVIGPTTGCEEFTIAEIRKDGTPVDSAIKGEVVSIAHPVTLRKSDKLYKFENR